MYTRDALLNMRYWRCYTKHVLLEMISTLDILHILHLLYWRCYIEHVLLEMLCILEVATYTGDATLENDLQWRSYCRNVT